MAKYTFDEHGDTFNYFLLTTLAIILIPTTYLTVFKTKAGKFCFWSCVSMKKRVKLLKHNAIRCKPKIRECKHFFSVFRGLLVGLPPWNEMEKNTPELKR